MFSYHFEPCRNNLLNDPFQRYRVISQIYLRYQIYRNQMDNKTFNIK